MEFLSAVLPFLVVLFAYFVRGIAGFGSALITVPLLVFNYPLEAVVPIVVLMDYLGSLSQGINNRQHIAWGELAVLLPFTLVGVLLGLFVLHTVDAGLLLKLLGGFVIAFAIYQLLPAATHKGSRLYAIPSGFLGGSVGTVFGTGGPFYVTYFLFRGLTKEAFRPRFAAYFVVDGSLRIAGFLLAGFYLSKEAIELLWLLPIAGLGLYIGGRTHLSISSLSYKRLISGLLILSGASLLFR